jgi:hypothetical protein
MNPDSPWIAAILGPFGALIVMIGGVFFFYRLGRWAMPKVLDHYDKLIAREREAAAEVVRLNNATFERTMNTIANSHERVGEKLVASVDVLNKSIKELHPK